MRKILMLCIGLLWFLPSVHAQALTKLLDYPAIGSYASSVVSALQQGKNPELLQAQYTSLFLSPDSQELDVEVVDYLCQQISTSENERLILAQLTQGAKISQLVGQEIDGIATNAPYLVVQIYAPSDFTADVLPAVESVILLNLSAQALGNFQKIDAQW